MESLARAGGTEPGGRKIPYRIFLENGDLMFMAGVWDEWKKGSEIKRTFSIITTTPNQEMTALHNRMPVILPDVKAQQRWLSSQPLDEALALLQPVADGSLVMYRVSEKLNKPGYDAADLQEEIEDELRLF